MAKIPKYARRHVDGRILCCNRRCGFCFGEVRTVPGLPFEQAHIDAGFTGTPPARPADDPIVWRHGDYAADAPLWRYTLDTDARLAYQEARGARSAGSFRAPGRYQRGPAPITDDVEIVCPEHGAQVLSPEHLGAITIDQLVRLEAFAADIGTRRVID